VKVAAPLWADAACDGKINPAIAKAKPSDNRVELDRRETTVADAVPGSGMRTRGDHEMNVA
jgi:hypothetical protein